MIVEFEVQGGNATELWTAAKAQAEQFADGHPYEVVEVVSNKRIVRGDNAIVRWMADVTVRVDGLGGER